MKISKTKNKRIFLIAIVIIIVSIVSFYVAFLLIGTNKSNQTDKNINPSANILPAEQKENPNQPNPEKSTSSQSEKVEVREMEPQKNAQQTQNQMKIVRGILVVNKKYSIPKDYNPGENKEAKQAFLSLKSKMQQLGFPISDYYSGFRSYQTQSGLYNNYVTQHGRVAADTFSARAGHSEHQSGLAFDFVNSRGQLLGSSQDGYDSPAANWLAKNAHNYGFIVRYQKGKEHITGYTAEPWHVRYIGELAGEIYESGKTLEEFLGVEGGDY